jgi:hypothetical protein
MCDEPKACTHVTPSFALAFSFHVTESRSHASQRNQGNRESPVHKGSHARRGSRGNAGLLQWTTMMPKTRYAQTCVCVHVHRMRFFGALVICCVWGYTHAGIKHKHGKRTRVHLLSVYFILCVCVYKWSCTCPSNFEEIHG